jgi:predicted RNase H-like HicB family nuclease
MKTEDQYLKFVRWSEEDGAYVGYCPDLFPWGGVCDGEDEEETYRRLRELIHEEVEQLISAGKELPVPVTRPMREAAGV